MQQTAPTSLAEVFTYIQPKRFFTELVPGIRSWHYKLKGKNGRGKAMAFTQDDLALINGGIIKLHRLMAETSGAIIDELTR